MNCDQYEIGREIQLPIRPGHRLYVPPRTGNIGSPITILQGDALERLRELPDESVQCCVTSPPYWGLRDYGVAGQIGLEPTLEEFISKLVAVFREVRRVLKNDGTCWVNMGDSYASAWPCQRRNQIGSGSLENGKRENRPPRLGADLKDKDLCGQPWMLAFALRADGWFLRSDIIWHKPNPMPESCTDRPTKSHEYLFLLTKSGRYFYDAQAIKEPVTGGSHARGDGVNPKAKGYKMPDGWDTGEGAHGAFHRNGCEKGKTPGKNSRIHVDRDPLHTLQAKKPRQNESFSAAVNGLVDDRNKRTVWTVATFPCAEAHFATFPPNLIKPCILAGTRPGDAVLDPFGGSGTTGMVALELGRQATLIELNPEYVKLIEKRTSVTIGLPLEQEASA